jgi:hypothetical protein
MSMFQHNVLAAETYLAGGLTGLKSCDEQKKGEKSLMDLEGMRKLTESKMEGQATLPLKALIRKTAPRCLLLTWRGRKFNLTKSLHI